MEITTTETLDATDLRELGNDAIFTISSAKPGNGVEQLRDNNLETYWQSDGAFPHYINIQFLKRVSVQKICLYLDYNIDESYTPKKFAISSGSSLHDLYDITSFELIEPVGWITISLESTNLHTGSDQSEVKELLRTHLIQVKVLSMHQNGRDTHIRQLKIFGPRESLKVMGNYTYDQFKSLDMQQYALIR